MKLQTQRILLSVSILGLIIAGVSCTKTNSSKSTAETKKKTKIGFILATMNQERYQKDRKFFLEYAKSKGADVEFASCDDKVNLQTSKVETLLAKEVDVLVVQPVDGKTAAPIVRMAKQDGVPVVAYDRLIKNAELAAYVTQDSFRVGELQAEAAIKKTGGKGQFIILKGEAGHSVAEAITRGNLSVLKKYPDVKIVVEQYHPGWSTALALATVENALTRYQNKISAILANNDGMALGATQALEEQGLSGKVFVAGADADLSAVKDILKGKQSLTVLKGIRPLAEAAVDLALELAAGKKVTTSNFIHNGKMNVPVMNTPVFSVVRENIETQIVDYGFHSRESVYGSAGR